MKISEKWRNVYKTKMNSLKPLQIFTIQFNRWLLYQKISSRTAEALAAANKPKILNASKELKNYLESKECLKVVTNFIPNRFLRVKKVPNWYNFVVDDDVAAQIAKVIQPDIVGNAALFEANPGLGLLTRYMLQLGAEKLTLFDPVIRPLAPLQQLVRDNPERVTVIPSDIFKVYQVLAQDKFDNGERFETMFKSVKFRQWTDEPSLKVVGMLQSTNYLKYLTRAIAFHDPILKIGRIQNILLLPEKVYRSIATPYGRIHYYVLFKHFFDLDLLGEFPRRAFLPWEKGKIEIAKQVVYLVRITPKANILERHTQEEMKALFFFVRALTRSRSNKVIAFFESWAPSSGLRLIQEGLSPFSEVEDLSVSEIIHLFEILFSLPDFDETNFVHIQESALLADTNLTEEPSKKHLRAEEKSQNLSRNL